MIYRWVIGYRGLQVVLVLKLVVYILVVEYASIKVWVSENILTQQWTKIWRGTFMWVVIQPFPSHGGEILCGAHTQNFPSNVLPPAM